MSSEEAILNPGAYTSTSIDILDSKYLYEAFYRDNPGAEKVVLERYPNDRENHRWVFPYPQDIWDAWFNTTPENNIYSPTDVLNYIPPPVEGPTWGYEPNPSKPEGRIYPRKYERLWMFIHDPQKFLYPNGTDIPRKPFPRYNAKGNLPMSGIFPSLCPLFLPDIKTRPPYSAWQHPISLRHTDVKPGFLDFNDQPAQRIEIFRAFDNSIKEGSLDQYVFRPSTVPYVVLPSRPDYSRTTPLANDTSFVPVPYKDFIIHAASAYRTNGWYLFYRQKIIKSPHFAFPKDQKKLEALIAIRRALFASVTGGVYGFNYTAVRNAVYTTMQSDTSTYIGGRKFEGGAFNIVSPTDLTAEQQFAKANLDSMESLVRLSLTSVMYELAVDDNGEPVFETVPYRMLVINVIRPSDSPVEIYRSFYSFPDPIELSVPPFLSATNVGQLDLERNARNIDWVRRNASAGFIDFTYLEGSPHRVAISVRHPGQYRVDVRTTLAVGVSGLEVLRYRFFLTIEKLSVVHAFVDYENIENNLKEISFERISEAEKIIMPERYRPHPSTIVITDFANHALAGVVARDDATFSSTKAYLNSHFETFELTRTTDAIPENIVSFVYKNVYTSPGSTFTDSFATSVFPFRMARKYSAPFHPVLLFYTFNTVIVKVGYFGQVVRLEPYLPSIKNFRIISRLTSEDGSLVPSPDMTVATPHNLGIYKAELFAYHPDGGDPFPIDIITYSVEMANGVPKRLMLFSTLYRGEDGTRMSDPPFLRAMCKVYARDRGLNLADFLSRYLFVKDYAAVVDRFLLSEVFYNPRLVVNTRGEQYPDSHIEIVTKPNRYIPLQLPYLRNKDNPRAVFDPFRGKWRRIPGGDIVSPEDVFYRYSQAPHMNLVVHFMGLIREKYNDIVVANQELIPQIVPKATARPPLIEHPTTIIFTDDLDYTPPEPLPPFFLSRNPPILPPEPEPDLELNPFIPLPGPSVTRPRRRKNIRFPSSSSFSSLDEKEEEEEDRKIREAGEARKARKDLKEKERQDAFDKEFSPSKEDPSQGRMGGISEKFVRQRLYFDTHIAHLKKLEHDCAAAALEQLGKDSEVYLSYINRELDIVFKRGVSNDARYRSIEAITSTKAELNRIGRMGANARSLKNHLAALFEPGSSMINTISTIVGRRSNMPYYRSAGVSPYPVAWTLTTEASFPDSSKLPPYTLENDPSLLTTVLGINRLRSFAGPDLYTRYDAEKFKLVLSHIVDRAAEMDLPIKNPFSACLLTYCILRKAAFSTPSPNYLQPNFVASVYQAWFLRFVAPKTDDVRKRILSLLSSSPDIDWFITTTDAYQFYIYQEYVSMWPFYRHDQSTLMSLIASVRPLLENYPLTDDVLCDLLSIIVPEVALVWIPTVSWHALKKSLFDLAIFDIGDIYVPPSVEGGYDVYNATIGWQYTLSRHLQRALLSVADLA